MPSGPQSTLITTAIVEKLQGISTSNDYHTNLGERVYKGRGAMYQGDTTNLPYVCVVSLSDGPSSSPRKQSARSRDYSIEAVLNADDSYHEAQDMILWDLIKALSYRTVSDILSGTVQELTIGDASLDLPEPGSNKVLVVLPLTVIYVDQFY